MTVSMLGLLPTEYEDEGFAKGMCGIRELEPACGELALVFKV